MQLLKTLFSFITDKKELQSLKDQYKKAKASFLEKMKGKLKAASTHAEEKKQLVKHKKRLKALENSQAEWSQFLHNDLTPFFIAIAEHKLPIVLAEDTKNKITNLFASLEDEFEIENPEFKLNSWLIFARLIHVHSRLWKKSIAATDPYSITDSDILNTFFTATLLAAKKVSDSSHYHTKQHAELCSISHGALFELEKQALDDLNYHLSFPLSQDPMPFIKSTNQCYLQNFSAKAREAKKKTNIKDYFNQNQAILAPKENCHPNVSLNKKNSAN